MNPKNNLNKFIIIVMVLFFSNIFFSCALIFSPKNNYSYNEGSWVKIKDYQSQKDGLFNIKSMTTDSDSNIYLVGSILGEYNFGQGVIGVDPIGTIGSGSSAAVIVKFDTYGNALWVRTIIDGNDTSVFYGVATDKNDNIYVVGYQEGKGAYKYSNNLSLLGSTNNKNGIIIKYDSNGNVIWGSTPISCSSSSSSIVFNSLIINDEDNIVIVGSQSGKGTFEFGEELSLALEDSSTNALIFELDARGKANWSTILFPQKKLIEIAEDQNGDFIVIGNQYSSIGRAYYGYLAKFDSAGNLIWLDDDNDISYGKYNSLALDDNNDIYIVGNTNSYLENENPFLLKYSTFGYVIWNKVFESQYGDSYFYDIKSVDDNHFYIAGSQGGVGLMEYGNGISINNTQSRAATLINFNSEGYPIWEKHSSGVVDESHSSSFSHIAIDNNNNTVLSGFTYGSGSVIIDEKISVTLPVNPSYGSYLLVKLVK